MSETPEEREERLSLFATHLQGLIALSTVALNSIILANGTAAAAVLALLGSIWDKEGRNQVLPPAIDSLAAFGMGVFTAILAACIGYLSQSAFKAGDDQVAADKRDGYYGIGRVLRAAAITFAFIGVALFAFGAWNGLAALRSVAAT